MAQAILPICTQEKAEYINVVGGKEIIDGRINRKHPLKWEMRRQANDVKQMMNERQPIKIGFFYCIIFSFIIFF